MKRIYMDNAATTEMRSDVKSTLINSLDIYANPSSLHREGQEANFLLEKARRAVANILGAKPNEIYFTNGGTESNNWAIRGVLSKLRAHKNHIITSKIEHPSILSVCKYLSTHGYEVSYIDVDKNGLINIDQLKNEIKDETALISIAYVNNEVGIIQNIKALSAIANETNISLHTDAVQAITTINTDVVSLGVDLMSLSAHKIYGPKGVGALFIKDKTGIDTFMLGGEQEKNKRAGTENINSIVAFGKACEILKNEREQERKQCTILKKRLIEGLSNIKRAYLISNEMLTAPHIVSFYFENITSSELLTKLDLKGIAVSGGSACSAGSLNPSHVLLAMGYAESSARSLIRFSFSHYNTLEEVDYVIETLKESIS